jgi:hypothetical protein
MYWIQELSKLPQYKQEKLRWYGDRKLRRMFVKEFPNAYLHNPNKLVTKKTNNICQRK